RVLPVSLSCSSPLASPLPLSSSSFFFFSCAGHHRDLPSFPTRRSSDLRRDRLGAGAESGHRAGVRAGGDPGDVGVELGVGPVLRSEEHTSELQSLTNLVCRLLLEKKKKQPYQQHPCQ